MKSRITIEVDFENGNQPVIQIMQMHSDDVRDKLLGSFSQQFGGSSWCQIKWVSNYGTTYEDAINCIHISPIKPEQLTEQAKVMLEQGRLNDEWAKEVKEKSFHPEET